MTYILVIALLWNTHEQTSTIEVGRFSTLDECFAAAKATDACRAGEDGALGMCVSRLQYFCIKTPATPTTTHP